MSLMVTVYAPEGIVMAADSRLTWSTTEEKGDRHMVHSAVSMTDSNYKVFLTPSDVGISTYGAADVGGVPISRHIDAFINETLRLKDAADEPAEVASLLLKHFRAFTPPPATHFYVAGYTKGPGRRFQQAREVDIARDSVVPTKPLDKPEFYGASWGGEAYIMDRLLGKVLTMTDAEEFQPVTSYEVPWGFFTLQDAVDFAVYAIRSTIDSIRFQMRPKTVGGPIDVLVIKPERAWWVQRKELRAWRTAHRSNARAAPGPPASDACRSRTYAGHRGLLETWTMA
ncbi:MAG: hypothetical protein FJ318_08710 [SAR202 cluster bacterium]|nr:hypothetical protein [SAR202 cluster bacterium]